MPKSLVCVNKLFSKKKRINRALAVADANVLLVQVIFLQLGINYNNIDHNNADARENHVHKFL